MARQFRRRLQGRNAGTLPDKSVGCDTYPRGGVDLRVTYLLSGMTAHVVRPATGGQAAIQRDAARGASS
jgi:hypothetical protein